jgi:hypothetical protein
MSIIRLVFIWSALLAPFVAMGQEEPRMSLEERVAAAKLIVVGKLEILPGGKHSTCKVEVSQVLYGTMSTNKTLHVFYNSSQWLVPEIMSRTYPMKRGQSYICLVTDEGEPQHDPNIYDTRAVGKGTFGKGGSFYAHDGFELATDEVLKKVKALIAEKNTRKEGARREHSFLAGMTRKEVRAELGDSWLLVAASRPASGWSSQVSPPAGGRAEMFDSSHSGAVAACDVYWVGHTNPPSTYFGKRLDYFYYDRDEKLIESEIWVID